MARRRRGDNDEQQLALDLWAPPTDGGDDEPVRADGRAALASPPPRALPGDSRPGQLLLDLGGGGRPADRRPDPGPGGGGSAGRGLPGQARPAEHGPPARPGDRLPGPAPAAPGGRAGPGPAGRDGLAGPGVDPAGGGPDPSLVASGQQRGADQPGAAPAAPLARFRPAGQQDLAPSGAVSRIRANLQALRTLRTIQREGRPATPAEQALLARWSGWGAVPQVFDQARSDDYGWARQELAQLLSEAELAAAARNTINAHYTDADLVQEIWTGVQQLGFAGGQVLEPGCGSGNFIAFAPPDAHMIGVELEPATAAIARALYPDAQISAVSFAEFPMREGSVDLAVGNVPFAKVALHDRRHNAAGHSIHNHFIIKSLHLTRPGGLVAVLTSRYTMDARNPAARREIAALADLVGVIRLPSGAHQQAAGTQAVTDLLILRRREQHRTADTTAWEHARPVDLPGGELAVNEYFLDRPQAVLGELTADGGLHGRVDLLVQPTGPTPPALATALEQVAAHASRSDLTLAPSLARLSQPAGGAARRPDFPDSYRPDLRDGYLQASDGSFRQISHGQAEPYLVPASQARELRHLIGLRDAVVALLDAEAASADDTADLDRLRAQLNQRYDAYAAAHGPLNRFTWRHTGRLDPDTGQERLARVRPPQGGFRRDPFAPAVYALEHFDPVTQQATKASIFRQRVIAPRSPRLGADTPADALAICLDTFGEVRLDQVARLLGTDESTARAELGTLVFDDP